MKKIRRLFYGKVRAIERSTRRIRHELSPVRALFMCEALALGCVLLFMLTGNRVALLDAYGRRADLWMVIAAMVVAGMLHLFMNKRIASVLTRGFYAQPYDDRRILFDLGQAARGIATIEQLYKLVIEKIEEALHPENISIFVRDDKSGDTNAASLQRY